MVLGVGLAAAFTPEHLSELIWQWTLCMAIYLAVGIGILAFRRDRVPHTKDDNLLADLSLDAAASDALRYAHGLFAPTWIVMAVAFAAGGWFYDQSIRSVVSAALLAALAAAMAFAPALMFWCIAKVIRFMRGRV